MADPRKFVCQGCGKAHVALHGKAAKCSCGTAAALDILSADEHSIASILDYPSVYMGGPSHSSRRKSQRILEYLAAEGWTPPDRTSR